MEPLDFPIRDELVWAILSHQGAVEPALISKWRENTFQVKSALKWMLKNYLKDEFDKAVFVSTLEAANLKDLIPEWQDPVTAVIAIDTELDYSRSKSEKFCEVLVEAMSQFKNCDCENFCVKRQRLTKRKFWKIKDKEKIQDPPKFSRVKVQNMLKEIPPKYLVDDLLPLVQQSIGADVNPGCSSVVVSRPKPLIVAGRYVKLSRQLSQSPWFVDSDWKTETSVEQLLSEYVCRAAVMNQEDSAVKSVFVSSGREDIDVRCLGHGRPFILELSNYNRCPNEIAREFSSLKSSNNLDLLARLINSTSKGLILVRDLQFTNEKTAAAMMKAEDLEKVKNYRALCISTETPLTTEHFQRFCSQLNRQLPENFSWNQE
ncbi:hypothetical protein Ciccas_004683 [Cichlidogyrus casuarinus]|uniref:tRNA pseudouridine(55) synthase n=1 Tax=Cichlidogyrus casuarinus TaxID=1844966 RepID=A0ABD2QAT3_9PLAT